MYSRLAPFQAGDTRSSRTVDGSTAGGEWLENTTDSRFRVPASGEAPGRGRGWEDRSPPSTELDIQTNSGGTETRYVEAE